jgi:hypothetical protein
LEWICIRGGNFDIHVTVSARCRSLCVKVRTLETKMIVEFVNLAAKFTGRKIVFGEAQAIQAVRLELDRFVIL